MGGATQPRPKPRPPIPPTPRLLKHVNVKHNSHTKENVTTCKQLPHHISISTSIDTISVLFFNLDYLTGYKLAISDS